MNIGRILLPLLLICDLGAAADIPPWMRSAAKTAFTPSAEDRAGVVLFAENVTTVEPNGDITSVERKVIRILGSEGKELGIISVSFSPEVKILSMRAWSMASDGKEYELKKRDAAELAVFSGELYADHRVKSMVIPAAVPGSVIAYEIGVRRRPYGFDDLWIPQETIPVVTASYELNTPPGWKFEARWFNASGRDPVVNGQVARWTAKNIASLKNEIGRPDARAVMESLLVQLVPPVNGTIPGRALTSWDGIARWYAQLALDRSSPTPMTRAKAEDLTRAAKSTPERIAALAQFAQQETRYVAIAIGIGGYQPHPADAILASRYGDCKDKVTILRSMLQAIGIETLFALANTDRGVVRADAPSLRAFNHVVAAIRLPDDYNEKHPSIVAHPRHGKLLLFDPTDEETPFGELPEYLQDNRLLLVEQNGGEIVHVAPHQAEFSRLHLQGDLTLDESGALSGSVQERRSGWIAAAMRGVLKSLTDAERARFLDHRIASWLHGAEIRSLKVENLETSRKELIISYTVSASKYVKTAGNLLLVRPRVIGRKSEFLFDLKDRRYGYELDAPSLETDEFAIRIPSRFTVDELPAKLAFTAPGFKYESESQVVDGVLRYKRRFEGTTRSVPFEKLKDLRSGFEKILSDEKNVAIFVID